MPFKDPDQKRLYHRLYMRRRRAGVKTRFLDWTRPYTIEGRRRNPVCLVQDGHRFNPQTGEFID